MQRFLPMTLVALLAAPALAGEVVPPISKRFTPAEIKEVPDFRMHVVPLIGKLGCNGRACHGSFQGQGGLRLSLFGYDFKMDHEAFTRGDNPRVDLDVPAESLMLEKATLATPHKGGKRTDVGSWQYKVLLRWIQEGAKGTDRDDPRTAVLAVSPKELLFQKAGAKTQLKVIAKWATGDGQMGVEEDVTTLCRFQTNNEQVCKIDAEGLVTAAEPGDTHIVVFYDNAVVPIPVLRPISDLVGPKYPKTPTPTEIDKHVVTKLAKLGVVQSDLCNDNEFLRRVSLDIGGTLPTPKEIEAFVADTSSDKRAKKIDELLERPTYTAWWTTLLCDYTGNRSGSLNNVLQIGNRAALNQDWYDWIYKRVAENVAYDKLMEGIVLATSRKPDQSYTDYCKEMSDIYGPAGKSFADREGLTYFWARQGFQTSQEKALGFAYSFLGIRIQCAECHKHPFDQWTQDDFKQFTGFFAGVTYNRNSNGNPETKKEYDALMAALALPEKAQNNERQRQLADALKEGKVIPFPELYVRRSANGNRRDNDNKNRGRNAQPAATAKLLGSGEVDLTKYEDSRAALMDWMRDKNNPYFARAFVNRVWSNYFNVGIVTPADDNSLANPPSNKPLLDYLSQGFIDHGFDMKWVHREICNSRTYQLSWQPNATNKLDERNFSHAIPRRLPAEIAVDAIRQATAGDAENLAMQTEIKGRKISFPGSAGGSGNNNNQNEFALIAFGKSIRESNCDCDRSMEASLLQTVYLQNDQDVYKYVENPGGWADQVVHGEQKAKQRDKGDPDGLDRQIRQVEGKLEQIRKKGDDKNLKAAEERLAELKKQRGGERSKDEAKPQAVKLADSQAVIRQAYLRTLSRLPTDAEAARSQVFIDQCETPDAAARGILWALLNTKEFIVNH